MVITRSSLISGILRSKELDITEEQLEKYRKGALLQDVFPHLSADDREFFVSGITPDEWNMSFEEEDEEEE